MYIYIFTHTHTYIYIYIYMYVYMYMYIYISTYIYTCTYIYIYVYMYMCVHTHTCTHTHTYAREWIIKHRSAFSAIPCRLPSTYCNTMQHTATHCNTLWRHLSLTHTHSASRAKLCRQTTQRFCPKSLSPSSRTCTSTCPFCRCPVARTAPCTRQSSVQCVAVRSKCVAVYSKCVAECSVAQTAPSTR